MKEYENVVLIETAEQWDDYSLNTRHKPTQYPVVAWATEEDFGIAGYAMVSYFAEIPSSVIDDHTIEVWLDGFDAAVGVLL